VLVTEEQGNHFKPNCRARITAVQMRKLYVILPGNIKGRSFGRGYERDDNFKIDLRETGARGMRTAFIFLSKKLSIMLF
jgi:hypothetical protein